jgi:hypothetical protein
MEHLWTLTESVEGLKEETMFQNNLFFAEITRIGGAYKEFAISCFYMLKTNDNGHCRGCTNNGSVNLKHPNKADDYSGRHRDAYLPYNGESTTRHHS